jgi:putative oxidoreductase
MEQDLGLLVIRLVVGLTFVAHGAQKVLGVWNGPGMVGWTGAMEHMGFRPARYWAMLSAGVELGCGTLIAIGFLTPIAAAALLGHATVIILKVQLPRGFWNSKGGIEFPLSLAGALVAIILVGPGGWSIDGILHLGLMSEGWVKLLGVVLGIGGGAAIYLWSVRPSASAPAQ